MNRKVLSTLLSLLMILPIVTVLPINPTAAQAQTTIEVINPLTGDNTFYFIQYGDGGAGRTFVVEVWIKNAVSVALFQVALAFDKTMLKVVDFNREKDATHFFAGKSTIDAPPEINQEVIDGWNAEGLIVYGSSTFPMVNVAGSGWTAKITFEITKNVTKYNPLLESYLVLVKEDTFVCKLEDKDGNPQPFDTVDGHFKLEWREPPIPKPWLEVVPGEVKLGYPMGPSIIGTPKAIFTVEIWIRNVDPRRKLIGIQSMVLHWDTTLLRLLNSWEGPFLKSFAPYGTLWINVTDPAPPPNAESLTIGVIMWPNPATGEWDFETWPEGEGVVATVQFEAILQEEYPWTAQCPIDVEPLFGEYFIDANLEWIPYEPEKDGKYIIIGWILGRMIDVYVPIYPDPYGGQGLNETSDMFRPQKTVPLWANVTYNAEPVQSKLVTFEIINPKGEVVAVRVAYTDENGVARTEFGIPWPCEDPWETIFGEWTVVASVDIRCTVVKDWLRFKVWWEVEIVSVTPKQTSYKKCENAEFEITIRTYREQKGTAIIAITVYDDLDVPIGHAYVPIDYGHDKHVYCQFWNYTTTLSVPVPKWAFVGVGKVYAVVLSNYPSKCGDAYGPEASATFSIVKSG